MTVAYEAIAEGKKKVEVSEPHKSIEMGIYRSRAGSNNRSRAGSIKRNRSNMRPAIKVNINSAQVQIKRDGIIRMQGNEAKEKIQKAIIE